MNWFQNYLCSFHSISAKTTSGEKCKRKIVQLNTVRVWKWGDNKAPQFDEKTYEVAKSIVLAKVNIKSCRCSV